MGALDGFLAGLAGGGCAPARDEVEDGVHPAAALAGAGRHQALCISILPQGDTLVSSAPLLTAVGLSCFCKPAYCHSTGSTISAP